jgi:hypothetical protein
MNMSLQSFIDRFNNNNKKFISGFGSDDEDEWIKVERFLNIVKKRNLLSKLDLNSIQFDDEDQNLFDFFCFKEPELREKLIEQICRQLYRNIKYDNGKVYLILKDMDDLSYLFCEDSRSEMSSQEMVRSILSEDFFEPYPDTTNDVFNDVIEVLTPDNFKILCDEVKKNLGSIDINQYSDKIYNTLIPDLATESGNENVLKIDDTNIKTLLNDEDTFLFIAKEILGDQFYYSLFSCHGNAYNSVLVNEWYNQVTKELESFGFGKGVWKSDKDKKNIFVTDITEFFHHLVGEFLYTHLEYTTTNLNDFSNFFTLFDETIDQSTEIDCLKLRLYEYPNSRKVDKEINDTIFDYIEF